MKVACPVWGGGKGGDNFKTLPIAIFPLYQDAQRGRNRPDRGAEVLGHVYEVPVSGRADRGKRRGVCYWHAHFQQHDGVIYHAEVFTVPRAGGASFTVF